MKKLILLALILIICRCTSEIQESQIKGNVTNIKGWYCSIIEIDSCEYIQGGYMLSHKGNCKYCAERRKKEQEELIRKIK